VWQFSLRDFFTLHEFAELAHEHTLMGRAALSLNSSSFRKSSKRTDLSFSCTRFLIRVSLSLHSQSAQLPGLLCLLDEGMQQNHLPHARKQDACDTPPRQSAAHFSLSTAHGRQAACDGTQTRVLDIFTDDLSILGRQALQPFSNRLAAGRSA